MVACGGPNVPDSTTTPPGSFKEAFSQLEARGELPVLDRTDTIAGIDANQNGVRDDIEAFINSLPDTPVQKKGSSRISVGAIGRFRVAGAGNWQ